jgi:hypothetical protein
MSVVPAPAGRRRRGLALLALACLAAWTIVMPGRALAAFGDEYGLAPAQGAIPGAAAFWAGTCDLASRATEYEESPPPASPRDCIDTGTVNLAATSPLALSPAPAWRLAATTQAGAHPDATTLFAFTRDTTDQSGLAKEGNPFAAGSTRDVKVKLPVGTIGDPDAVAKCSGAQFAAVPPECPPQSQVGVTQIYVSLGGFRPNQVLPVYDLAPLPGRTAEFGIPIVGGATPIRIVADARTDSDFGVTAGVERIPTAAALMRQTITLWGVPWAASHDPFRPRIGLERHAAGGVFIPPSGLEPADQVPYEPSWGPIEPFFTNPTSCDGEEPLTSFFADSWQNPAATLPDGEPDPSDPAWVNAVSPSPPLSGCERLSSHFDPGFTFRPQSNEADSPSAYSVDLSLPQNNQPPAGVAEDPSDSGAPAYWKTEAGLATAHLRDTTVTLPQGVAVDPSAANGLAACTESEVGLITTEGAAPNPIRFDDEKPTCPDASKIGTVEIETPLLEEKLEGTVYLAAQTANPFHSLLALYLVGEDPERGLTIKLAGKTTPDPVTGQLTATFDENPQLPFEHLKLSFKGGPAAPLKTPATCGTFTTNATLTPWSGDAAAQISDSFDISAGAGGGACASSEAAQSNRPSFSAGTVDPLAGSYSPFVMKLSRGDGTQRFKSLDLALPPGLTGKLAGVPYCPQSGIDTAGSRNKPGDGALEQSSPSCPAASQVGTVTVGAGAGEKPLYVQGKAYLAGPYKGAPLSLLIVTPAVAGPFDLGVVAVRAALFVNPEDAQITVKSDPLPTILEGIPLDIRSIAVSIDRPGFTLNPTSCEPMALGGEVESPAGNVATVSNRFQVGNCESLAFKPKLQISLKGSTKHAGHPALKAVLTYPKQGAYANIRRAQVNLPHSEFLDQGNLNKTCTKPVLLAGACPAKSIYGKAKAWTPLLEAPLEGPVYLVGGYGYKLPALVAELNGQIRVVLKGKVDSGPNHGIRNTFEAVPDAPVEKFELQMKGGKKYSLLENSENLCAKPQKAIARFTAQNGKVLQAKPLVANECGKKHRHKRAGKGHPRKARK